MIRVDVDRETVWTTRGWYVAFRAPGYDRPAGFSAITPSLFDSFLLYLGTLVVRLK